MALDIPAQLAGDLGQVTNFADTVFGQVPGTPAGTQPTVQLRQLLLQALQVDEQARLQRFNALVAAQQGNEQLRLQSETLANQFDLQSRQLELQAQQFSAQFGLQNEESLFKRQLAAVQFGFEQQKYATDLAANPRNLIQSALFQGTRNPNAPGPATPSPFGDQAVPVSGTTSALMQRAPVPVYGAAPAAGFFTSLDNLSQNQDLRLLPGRLDLPSLRNVSSSPADSGYLSSALSAQGQDPQDWFGFASRAGRGQQGASVLFAR